MRVGTISIILRILQCHIHNVDSPLAHPLRHQLVRRRCGDAAVPNLDHHVYLHEIVLKLSLRLGDVSRVPSTAVSSTKYTAVIVGHSTCKKLELGSVRRTEMAKYR